VDAVDSASTPDDAPEESIDVPAPLRGLRRYALDGALLLFDRATGTTAICDGPETAHLRRRVPRVIQMAITNACNFACGYCSRDVESKSTWTEEDAFVLLRDLARAGVMEVAFGGGEPLAFRGFDRLVRRLHDETPLAVSATTNGSLLDHDRVRALAPALAQLRVSLHETPSWTAAIGLLVNAGVACGANVLVSPRNLDGIETIVLDLVARGCCDVLLLNHVGGSPNDQLSSAQTAALARSVHLLALALARRATIKLSVCWGTRLETVPRLIEAPDCAAGSEFIVVTSDRRLQACSFQDQGIPFRDAEDLLRLYRAHHTFLASASARVGCARVTLGRRPLALPVLR
jgi:MoaA/NifB/PqqE/SkfB family radical SAM enzyme